jgi:hypothetical protein
MTLDLEALKELAGRATGGEWVWGMRYISQRPAEGGYRFIAQHPMAETAAEGAQWERDAAFIAASREAVPALIAEVERLREALANARDYVLEADELAARDIDSVKGYPGLVAQAEARRDVVRQDIAFIDAALSPTPPADKEG